MKTKLAEGPIVTPPIRVYCDSMRGECAHLISHNDSFFHLYLLLVVRFFWIRHSAAVLNTCFGCVLLEELKETKTALKKLEKRVKTRSYAHDSIYAHARITTTCQSIFNIQMGMLNLYLNISLWVLWRSRCGGLMCLPCRAVRLCVALAVMWVLPYLAAIAFAPPLLRRAEKGWRRVSVLGPHPLQHLEASG